MRKKPLFGTLNFGLWNGHCEFIVGASYEQILSRLKKSPDKEWKGIIESNRQMFENSYALTVKESFEYKNPRRIDEYYLIKLNEFNFKKNYDIATLAHEITHLSQFFLSGILDRNREIEAEAYFHSHIMRQCLDLLRKW